MRRGKRSGFEIRTAERFQEQGVEAQYEPFTLAFREAEKTRSYTPDWLLPNGIIVETKGWFSPADRKKHLLIRESHPDLDIRFVFERAGSPILPNSKTTYAMWAKRHRFLWAEEHVPDEWLRAKPSAEHMRSLKQILETTYAMANTR